MYKPAVLAAFLSLGDDVSRTKCAEVRAALCERRAQLRSHRTARPALDLHRQQVRELRSLRSLPPNVLCIFCLMGLTQQPLPCGHTLCDVCVRSLSDCIIGEYCYMIRDCIFCSQTIRFQRCLKPPTCGIRALSLDGGGIRGVISLENMLLMQDELGKGSELRFLDQFDLVVATSAG